MTPEIWAEWLHRQRHRVIRTASTYWYDASPHVYQAFPYDWLIQPSRNEVDTLWKQGIIALRYSSPLMTPMGQLSYHVVCTEKNYDLGNLPKKARYDVSKGMSYSTIEPIPFSRLAEEGWLLRVETLERQRRTGMETRAWWRGLCLSADGLPGFEAWGAIHNRQLVAVLLAFTQDGCCSILYQQSLTPHMKYGVNNALAYVFTSHVLSRPNVSKVFYGLHSLDAPTSVDEFKFRMGYRAQLVRQRVVFHPWASFLVNRVGYLPIKQLHVWLPRNSIIAKIEGMARFSRLGHLAINRQTLPSALHNMPLPHLLASSAFVSQGGEYTGGAPITIRPMLTNDLEDVVAIHLKSFPGFFLSFLGPGFLRLLYKTIHEDNEGLILVASCSGWLVGFVAGVVQQSQYFRRILQSRKGWSIAVAAIGAMIRSPGIIPRVLRAVNLPDDSLQFSARASLMSIAVHPTFQSQGVGQKLMAKFCQAMVERDVPAFCLSTDRYSNDQANRFYQKWGFQIIRSYVTPEGREMNEYFLPLTKKK